MGPFQPFVQGVTSALEEFQEQLDVYEKYDWDFDNYLEEDVPAAVRCFFFFWGGFFHTLLNIVLLQYRQMKIFNDEHGCDVSF